MLTSLQNPLVKQMRKLHRAKERSEQGLFLLEGTHLLQEANAVHYPIHTLCCTLDWQARHPALWQQVSQQAQRTELVSQEVLQAIATTVNPEGVVAIAQRKMPDRLQPKLVRLGIALETLQDPGNLGTVIRTAAAVSADGLWLSQDSVDLDHPKVLRASAGQWFRLPMQVSRDLANDLRTLQAEGIQIVATLPTANRTYWEVDFTQPTVILLGNEGAGLSTTIAAIADLSVQIPQAPAVESLNVGIAAALLLYEAQRQQEVQRSLLESEFSTHS